VTTVPSPAVSDISLSYSEPTSQVDLVSNLTEPRYSTAATSSYESQEPTTADVHSFTHSAHGLKHYIPENDGKHVFPLTSYGNQEQQALDTLEPSTLESWSDPEPASLSLPMPILYSKMTEGPGTVVFGGKEGSQGSLSDTGLPHTVGLDDGVWGSVFISKQHGGHSAQSSTSIDTAMPGQTSTKDDTSTSAIMKSTQWMHDPASSRINWSIRVSKQGVELIVMSVVGGGLAFVGLVLLHRLVSRNFKRKNERSRHLSPVSLANSFSREESSTHISDLAEFSHLSIES
jgi:hypothetical protein